MNQDATKMRVRHKKPGFLYLGEIAGPEKWKVLACMGLGTSLPVTRVCFCLAELVARLQ